MLHKLKIIILLPDCASLVPSMMWNVSIVVDRLSNLMLIRQVGCNNLPRNADFLMSEFLRTSQWNLHSLNDNSFVNKTQIKRQQEDGWVM